MLFMTNLFDHRYDLFLPSQEGAGVSSTWSGTANAAVPEPPALLLSGFGLICIAVAFRKKH